MFSMRVVLWFLHCLETSLKCPYILLVATGILWPCLFTVQGAGDADIFNTRIQIKPNPAAGGDTVEFTCDFTLVDGLDLHLLYWENTDGNRLFSFDNNKGESKVHDPYKNKITSYKYLDSVPGGGEWDRRHILRMRVDHCDRATYRCLVLNQEDFSEGSDQKALEIIESLPNPEVCLLIGGECYTEDLRKEHTTIIVICSVTESSVEPEIKVTRNGEIIPSNMTMTTEVDGCLYSARAETGELVVATGEGTTFICEVNYGGTGRTGEVSLKCEDNKCPLCLQVIIPCSCAAAVIIIVIVVVICYKKRRRKNGKDNPTEPTPANKYELKKLNP